MRHIRRVLAAAVALALALGVAGCVDRTDAANQAIDAANVQIQAYTRAGGELEALMSEAESLPMDPASAEKGIALTDRMKVKLEEQRKAAEAARADIARIKTLNVRAEFKTYADKEIAVTDVLLQQTPVATALVDDMRRIYDLVAAGKATQAEIQSIGQRIDAGAGKLTALEEEASKREKEASDYFASRKLGGA